MFHDTKEKLKVSLCGCETKHFRNMEAPKNINKHSSSWGPSHVVFKAHNTGQERPIFLNAYSVELEQPNTMYRFRKQSWLKRRINLIHHLLPKESVTLVGCKNPRKSHLHLSELKRIYWMRDFVFRLLRSEALLQMHLETHCNCQGISGPPTEWQFSWVGSWRGLFQEVWASSGWEVCQTRFDHRVWHFCITGSEEFMDVQN